MDKVLIVLANGFEEVEALTVVDLLRRVDLKVTIAGLEKRGYVSGSHDITVQCDCYYQEIEEKQYDCLILPGGQPGTNNLKSNPRVIEWVKSFYSSNRLIAAICAAPLVLNEAGILAGKKVTSFPSEEEVFKNSIYLQEAVVQDGNIITSRGVGTAIEFALKIVENMKGEETANQLARRILWD
jgi:4-methyl-5(b-hydroxyethyl)-thiazole monophosphate biosynthesis